MKQTSEVFPGLTARAGKTSEVCAYSLPSAALRDEMYGFKAILADDESLKPWERIKLLVGEE